MKVLIAGDFSYDFYEKAFEDAFIELNCQTERFKWGSYFKITNSRNSPMMLLKNYYLRLQNKFILGPIIKKINNDLLEKCKIERPDLLFVYRGRIITEETLAKIKLEGITVFGYNNDDPFSDRYSRFYWKNFKRTIHFYDCMFAYRKVNIDEYIKEGAKEVCLLRGYYMKNRNFICTELDHKFKSDVLFIGHFENDGRDEKLVRLIQAGIKLKLLGTGWEKSSYYEFLVKNSGPIVRVDEDYNRYVNGAKIALVFLSKLNRDTYTRRCFEIPATKTFMLSEFSDELNELFNQGSEAEYFKDTDELIEKTIYYLSNNKIRETIAEAGYNKLLKAGHETVNRVRTVLDKYNDLQTIRYK